MDELLLVAGLVLFLALIVAPALAIGAWRKSSDTQRELGILRERLTALEQQLAGQVSAPSPQPLSEEIAEPEPAPVIVPAAEHPIVDPWAAQTALPEPVAVTEVATSTPLADEPRGGMISSLVSWFMRGNPLAKLGILLLFFGLAFLFRYSVERDLFPLELRLCVAALAAVVLLALGWRLRHKQPVYALILQGGATGVLYLTVFGAFRLWQMLPMTLAFALLLLICAVSVGLAVLQRALSLAMLASLGGYLAPLLLSTGGGSHIGLFSFYLLLSCGILAISVWQHWRVLNLLGLLFTFGVGGVWGLYSYQPAFYLSCQLFLIANIVLFGVLSVALSLRAQGSGQRIIDGVLLFAPPLIGFGMQYVLTQDFTFGPAFSALGFGAFYLLLAWLVLRRKPELGRPLVLAALALGGAFVTLAIPLALSARWTSMAWALEGLGILWLGVQQQQRRMSYSGTGLLLLAVGSALWAVQDTLPALSQLMIFAVLSLTWIAAAWLWRGLNTQGSYGLLAGGIIFWLLALHGLSALTLSQWMNDLPGLLTLTALSVHGWRWAAQRLRWRAFSYSVWLLWPLMLATLVWQIAAQGAIFSAGWQNLAWGVALPSAFWLLHQQRTPPVPYLSQGVHLSLFWMIVTALAAELWWYIDTLSWGTFPWQAGLAMTSAAATILLVRAGLKRSLWPLRVWPQWYGTLALAPMGLFLLVMLLLTNIDDGVVMGQGYRPLLNPLEEGAAFALMALLALAQLCTRYFPVQGREIHRRVPLLLAGLAFWWLNGLLLRSLAWYGGIDWSISALWSSRLVQTCFALFWMLVALLVMLRAARQVSRREWLCGAALLGVVIVKLMLVDSAGGGGLARAVAFIGVAVLVLIVGYFSPLPPRVQQTHNEEQG
ncbi:DUF2339 domain-containing protein [Pseudescherichia sp. L3]|uniref:DUF2339 domain-containing protein n=1 Tax=Pseudescherichia sp. L3 TaxID=2970817 RepID=UPI0021501F05|nr:DUF2339 domain-containing protein [Pseudescherichia sp. L3]MCR4456243.1 DUF2339 domain-containing protein [Pseudescherichia sp. L3]